MANLSEYLARRRGSANALASQAGISKSTVSAIQSGQRRASPELAKKIEEATGGEVTAASLLGLGAGASARSQRLHDGRWLVWASDSGETPIPGEVLRDLGVGPGEPVAFRRSERGWELSSAHRDLRGVQEQATKFARSGRSAVDELIAERRADAERE
jgi:transcriptional regulator with XRE-family HTH domain